MSCTNYQYHQHTRSAGAGRFQNGSGNNGRSNGNGGSIGSHAYLDSYPDEGANSGFRAMDGYRDEQDNGRGNNTGYTASGHRIGSGGEQSSQEHAGSSEMELMANGRGELRVEDYYEDEDGDEDEDEDDEDVENTNTETNGSDGEGVGRGQGQGQRKGIGELDILGSDDDEAELEKREANEVRNQTNKEQTNRPTD